MLSSQQILQKYWQHANFRGLQQTIVDTVLQQKDVLALLPTGGGKSICFQVPALINNGLCLVVAPLVALMKDQVYNLEKKNIPAIALYGGLNKNEVENILVDAVKNKYKFLYVSPERLQSKLFKAYLPQLPINLIAVDEAHCISQWGYDFRPAYLQIISLREAKPNVPIIALTASATMLVQKDIVEKLKLKEVCTFQQSFEKLNLSYSVFKVDTKITKAIEILTNVGGSSIVYCKNRRQTNYVAQLLLLHNISADYYHAGLPQEERSLKQQNWINNKTRVMVCTNAFGMGIDKPDVRTVIHYDVPDCLESYYQEAGRAGRDGKRAFAILLYHTNDVDVLECLPSLRFPPISEIRNVYQALANYLQIPVGMGEGSYYDFDILSFAKNFNLDIFLVLNVLKTLEHEGHIVVTDSVFVSPKAQFIADKYLIEEFGKLYPEIETVMKSLLRTYSGILDNNVIISEKQIAKICRLPYDKVNKDLQHLVAYKIINYTPQKETPQIYFCLNRAAASTLHINQEQYFKRKQQFELRVEVMLKYLSEDKKCRSQIISTYFNAGFVKQCESCDNCLHQKNIELTAEEFKKIEFKIIALIKENTTTIKEILPHFKTIKKEKLWKVLQFLQDEKQIHINQLGEITMK